MKSSHLSAIWFTTLFISIIATNSANSQDRIPEAHFAGFYIRAGSVQFDKAILMLQSGNDEIAIDEMKRAILVGIGIQAVPKDSNFGVNLGLSYWQTTLNNFQFHTSFDESYKDISYSMLLFDIDLLLLPLPVVPISFSVGLALGCSFQNYKFDGGQAFFGKLNGSRSHTIFRYGTKLGVKIVPMRFFTLDFEYRPMSSYSESRSLEYLYSDDKYNYYKIGDVTGDGPSERILAVSLSIKL